MSGFAETVARAIHDYKKILKRKLPQKHYTQKLQQLGINRMRLKSMSEIILLNSANRILQELEEHKANGDPAGLYSGVHEFIAYLRSILQHYRVEDNKVVNVTQMSSATLVKMIQILTLPNSKFTADTIKKLDACVDTIIGNGTKEQIKMAISGVRRQEGAKHDICLPLLLKLEDYYESINAKHCENINRKLCEDEE